MRLLKVLNIKMYIHNRRLMNMKKKILSICLVAAMTLSMIACGTEGSNNNGNQDNQTEESNEGEENNEEDGGDDGDGLIAGELSIGNITDYGVHKIGFANDDAATGFGAALTETIESYCEEIGWELVTADAGCDTALQATQVENMITAGCEVILMKPYDESSAGPISTACQEAGVPLICLTSPISTHYDVCVGADMNVTGKYIGNYIIEKFGKDIKFAYMRGTLSSEMFTTLHEAMINTLEEGGVEVVKIECPEGRKDQAMTMMENWLTDGVEIDVLWSDNSDMALGAWEALNAEGKAEDVAILCNGGEKDDMTGILNGQIYASWDGNTRTIAETAMDASVILLSGGDISGMVTSPDHMITLDDVEELMAQRGMLDE